jgi:hypothetical protein
MSETTTESEVNPNRIDRRSALKKAAVGGAIAWTAPTVLSSKVSAVEFIDGCTAKCAPQASGQSILITGSKGPCIDGAPAGQQRRTFNITSVTVIGGATCGCGGTAEVTYSPQVITYDDPDPNQGTRTVEIGTITVDTTCLDRQSNPITVSCSAPVVATFSGSCEGVGNTGFSISQLSNCTVQCFAN